MKIDSFIRKHSQKHFPHANELIKAIRDKECTLYHAPGIFSRGVSTSVLLHTYRRRVEHLKQFSTEHAKLLQKDTAYLCDRLLHSSDSRCQMWIFSFSGGRGVTVFEGRPSEEVLGCLKTVDKRAVSEEEWKELWGTSE